jgi:hypothetical protein
MSLRMILICRSGPNSVAGSTFELQAIRCKRSDVAQPWRATYCLGNALKLNANYNFRMKSCTDRQHRISFGLSLDLYKSDVTTTMRAWVELLSSVEPASLIAFQPPLHVHLEVAGAVEIRFSAPGQAAGLSSQPFSREVASR